MFSCGAVFGTTFMATESLWGDERTASNLTAATPPVSKSEMQGMVQKSLPFIEREGRQWRNDKQCLSCHRITFTVWSLNRASESGFDVELKNLRDWSEWSTDWYHLLDPKFRDDAEKSTTLLKENDAIGQLLLGRPRSENGTYEDSPWSATYREHLLKSQEETGAWQPRGQLPKQKRSLRETQEVTTMWSLIALLEYDSSDEATDAAVEKARDWLDDETSGESTEWWSVRLMLESATGREAKAVEMREALLARQHDDGGWGWLSQEDSDAFGTGVALYALLQDGVSRDHPSVVNAMRFLRQTQQGDGSWAVHGTKINSRQRVTNTATYWGTCWAVIATLEWLSAPGLRPAA